MINYETIDISCRDVENYISEQTVHTEFDIFMVNTFFKKRPSLDYVKYGWFYFFSTSLDELSDLLENYEAEDVVIVEKGIIAHSEFDTKYRRIESILNSFPKCRYVFSYDQLSQNLDAYWK